MNAKSATVAITHTNEKHRSIERVLGLVRAAIDLLGGIKSFVQPGATVLIKPNQTVFYSAEEGCTTDPLFVGALIRLAREIGKPLLLTTILVAGGVGLTKLLRRPVSDVRETR